VHILYYCLIRFGSELPTMLTLLWTNLCAVLYIKVALQKLSFIYFALHPIVGCCCSSFSTHILCSFWWAREFVCLWYAEMHFGNPEVMLSSDSELANLQSADNPRQVNAGFPGLFITGRFITTVVRSSCGWFIAVDGPSQINYFDR